MVAQVFGEDSRSHIAKMSSSNHTNSLGGLMLSIGITVRNIQDSNTDQNDALPGLSLVVVLEIRHGFRGVFAPLVLRFVQSMSMWSCDVSYSGSKFGELPRPQAGPAPDRQMSTAAKL